jgi:hypothetical protein
MDQIYRFCNFVTGLFSNQVNKVNSSNIGQQQYQDVDVVVNKPINKPKKPKRNVIKREKINFIRQNNFKPVKFHKNNH